MRLLLIGLFFISSFCYAGWPEFDVLSTTQVQGLITAGGCLKGYGKIPIGTKVEIHSWYIPHDQHWYWVYSGDGKCHKLSEELNYLSFNPQNGYSGDILTTYYGSTLADLAFSFAFTIPSSVCPDNGCPWYCAGLTGHTPSTRVACAMDT